MCANRGTAADPSVGVGAVLATPVPAAAVGATGDVVGAPGDAGDGWGSPAGDHQGCGQQRRSAKCGHSSFCARARATRDAC
jgi:hypothetical protein